MLFNVVGISKEDSTCGNREFRTDSLAIAFNTSVRVNFIRNNWMKLSGVKQMGRPATLTSIATLVVIFAINNLLLWVRSNIFISANSKSSFKDSNSGEGINRTTASLIFDRSYFSIIPLEWLQISRAGTNSVSSITLVITTLITTVVLTTITSSNSIPNSLSITFNILPEGLKFWSSHWFILFDLFSVLDFSLTRHINIIVKIKVHVKSCTVHPFINEIIWSVINVLVFCLSHIEANIDPVVPVMVTTWTILS